MTQPPLAISKIQFSYARDCHDSTSQRTNSRTIGTGNFSHTNQALRGFHMTIPVSHFNQLSTLPTNLLKLHRRLTSPADETRLQYLVQVSIGSSMPNLEVLDLERSRPTLRSWFHSCQTYAQPNSTGNSADVLFYKVYQQMVLWDIPLESVDTSLYGFAREVLHSLGQFSLPLSLGKELTEKTKMVRFLLVDMPSAYNLILGRPALNIFSVVVSTHHMKLKFPIVDKVGKVKGDQYTTQKCYIVGIKSNSSKMELDLPNKESNRSST
ncbi:hypothetical protein Sango_2310800 [Sesamum angolense]|uniref:Uncharacterized protein n=1 Tax=Sesamum angolense TaxID=2727404 RepID=A0AAE1WAF9_9LAMI|nr:hypothetical protein Sango_2310800 [Sesamum angolense]